MRPIAVLLCFLGLVPSMVFGQGGQSSGGRIPVQVVGGRLVVSCDLSTSANRIPVNLFLEFEGAFGLRLHNRAAAGIGTEREDGSLRPITLHLPDFELEVERRELGEEELYEHFTKYHSAEIGENALVGAIGSELLREWCVTFDLAAGYVELSPAGEAGAQSSGPRTLEDGTIEVPLALQNGLSWISVRLSDGRPLGLKIGCAQYDTLVDRALAESLGAPAGNIGPVRLGSVDLATFVALRPEEVVEVHPDGVLGVLGLGLLEHFRVVVDPGRRVVSWKESRPAEYPESDLAFFRARALEEAADMSAFLEQYPEARLSHEAAELVLEYSIAEGSGPEELEQAVGWMGRTTPKDLCTTRMLDLMKEMADAGEFEVVLSAGRLGVESGRDDRYPNAVHEVHGRLGRTLLDQGLGDEAWRHLLSAAFGLPEDGRINLDLGRFYESQERYRRAFSRYVQAVLQAETGAAAIEALQRVQSKLGDGEPFSVDTIDRMIAGKVRSFGAPSQFEASYEEPANRVVLCEFFTNPHQGNEVGGAIGGALGFEGLLSHFDADEVVLVTHHLPDPEVTPTCASVSRTRAELMGVSGPGTLVFDGVSPSPGAARWRQAEAVYTRGRSAAIERLTHETAFEFEIEATAEAGALGGQVTIWGPESAGKYSIQVLLVERGVLFPGKSTVVVHRHLVRASLVGDNGMDYAFEPEGVNIPIELVLADQLVRQEEFLVRLQEEGVGTSPRLSMELDPAQLTVVAFVYDKRSHEVVGVKSADVVSIEATAAPVGGAK